MIALKRSLVDINERALCMFICSVHVDQHMGLLDGAEELPFWPNFESSYKKIGPTTFAEINHKL